MLKEFRPAIVLLLAFTVLTGVVYPLVMTGLANVIFPYQARGSLLEKDGNVIGSDCWDRTSRATAISTGGHQQRLGPTRLTLRRQFQCLTTPPILAGRISD